MKRLLLLLVLLLSFIGFSQNEIEMQNGSWTECDFVLTDSGGLTGDYESNENFTLTLCPQSDGYVMIDFYEFSTQINLDILSVYNGDSTNSPLIGAFSGGNSPGLIMADNDTGCLTLNFVSNDLGVTNGWAGYVSCISSFEINQPTDYIICDDFGNGFGLFDLELKNNEILNGLDPANYTVTYHESETNALAGINPLISPYANVTNPQLIYIRVEDIATGNFETTLFNLYVNATPIPTLQDVYQICEGSSTTVESGLQQGDFSFEWYYNGIILPNENNSFLEVYQEGSYSLQVISWDNECSSITDFSVEYNSFLNVPSPTPYVICDDDGDGFATFDLNIKGDEILSSMQNPIATFTYHLTVTDANNGTDAIEPIFTNFEPYNQTIYVRVSSTQDDCFGVTTVELIVDVECISASSVEVIVCGDDPNIPVSYDLTSQEINMVDGQDPSNFTFTYYYAITNAETETDPITNPTVYSVSGNSSTVYVRIENNQSGSFTIAEIYVNFYLNPQISFAGPYTICDGNEVILYPNIGNDNGAYEYLWNTGETSPEIIVNTSGFYTVTVTDLISGCVSTEGVDVMQGGNAPVLGNVVDLYSCEQNPSFDLSVTFPEIFGNQDISQFIIGFFNTYDDALTNTNSIGSPSAYQSTNSNETIYVRVRNIGDECFSIIDFNIVTDNSCATIIDCTEEAETFSFCYVNDDTTVYQFESLDGTTPLEVRFLSGRVENNFDELIVLDSDGVTNLNPEATTYGYGGEVQGLYFVSTGNSISISVAGDGSISCETNSYEEISYTVSCVDLNVIPECNITLTEPLDGAIDVNEDADLTWNAPFGIVTGYKLSLGLTSGGTEVLNNVDVGNVLAYDLETLDYEVTYYLTIVPYNTNGDAEGCTEKSFTIRANPYQMVVCGDETINTTHCYDNYDTTEFSYQSSDDLPLTIYFNSGSTEVDYDEVYITDSDGTVLNPDLLYGNDGDFAGLSYTSTGSTITVRFDSDNIISCVSGSTCCTAPFDFDVLCTSAIGIIEVNAFIDENTNTVFDTNEFSFSNGYFTYEANGDGNINVVNSSTGHFQFISENDSDVYEITFNLYDESAGCYDITTAVFNNISVAEGSTLTVDFPVVEEQSCEDLAVYLINSWTPPRPGFTHENIIILENLGFTTITSGTVEFTHDPLLVYNGVTSVNPNYTITTTATGFTVDFVNLQPGNVEYIDVSLTCPASIELGDILTNTANYVTDSNDLVAGNNYSTLSELVVGSWDPNDKMESHGPKVLFDDFSTSDEWLYYTIRFQNLGTAAADFVRIEDVLDNQLNKASFQMLRSSHDYVVTRTDSSLEWYFEDINLPAEQDDAEGSSGFVYFRVQPNAGYASGDVIPNTAAIFFDFNAPVITNRFETEFVEEALSVSEFDFNSFSMYPNPAKDVLNIKLNNITKATLSIYDIQGKLVLEQSISETQNLELNVSDLHSGLYFVKLNTATKEMVKKLIIE
ncbi:T9SS type A sorting domain-containing protein [Psychroserpens ponticola]|uniref:T9SS type A sorting domain-containing protein n=1 Tax=Psychroserpens ponticola TaxID=2932268 RepID=A0ABY7RUE1_9FLAO|nr:T9SS type A sorting domain-containing protein [Psychroserpens ponticola]WCO00742.1 T9SS type A sorting domain-containing protein [Psychroserpens ponticola]